MTHAAVVLMIGVPPLNLRIEQVVDDARYEWGCTYYLVRRKIIRIDSVPWTD